MTVRTLTPAEQAVLDCIRRHPKGIVLAVIILETRLPSVVVRDAIRTLRLERLILAGIGADKFYPAN